MKDRLRKFLNRKQQRVQKTKRQRSRRRLRGESLEDRRLLATFVVNSVEDIIHSTGCTTSNCTLRDAVAAAESTTGADTIEFDASLSDETFVIRNHLEITESLTLVGLGAEQTRISGTNTNRLFRMGGEGQQIFKLQNVTLSRGRGITPGGAIQFGNFDPEDDDSLELHQVVVRDNTGTEGGGVYAQGGSLLISNSSFIGNRSTSGSGSAVMREDGTGAIVNTTFSDNGNGRQSAVLHVTGTSDQQSLSVISSTFAENASTAVTVQSKNTGGIAEARIQTSLFAQNATPAFRLLNSVQGQSQIVSRGHNLSDGDFLQLLDDPTDIASSNAMVGPLDSATATHPLVPGSPAIDAGGETIGNIPTHDQLGNPRVGPQLDIGAVESAFDLGDAPSSDQTGFEFSYPTRGADDGAVHRLRGPRLGSLADTDIDGTPSILADGDSQSRQADEDGVTFLGGFFQPLDGELTIIADLQNADSNSNLLDAWADWNRNGSWDDEGEQFASSLNLGTSDSQTTIDLEIPADQTDGPVYFRFRVSTEGGLSSGGMASDGEVEDHLISLVPEDFPLIVDTTHDEFDGDLSAGDLSLREAIAYANSRSGDDSISVASALDGQSIVLAEGQLQITDNLTIQGNGAQQTTVDADQKSRIFEVSDSDVSLSIRDMTLTGGAAPQDTSGGAIHFDSLQRLEIERSEVTNNQSSTSGGAIYSLRGDIDIVDSKITGNVAQQSGGAVFAYRGSVTISNSTFNSNTSLASGGGLFSEKSRLQVISSTFENNTATESGGGIYTNNNATGSSTTSLIGTTLSGNSASRSGGGLAVGSGLATITSSTIADNFAPIDSGAGVVSGEALSSRIVVASSIIAENRGTDVDVAATDLTLENSSDFESLGFNLIGSGSAAQAFDGQGDSLGIDPLLEPLAENGGVGRTHALRKGSPAIDAADRTALPSDSPDLDSRGAQRLTDLPGIENAADGLDIGAVEMIGLLVDNAAADEADETIAFAVSLTNSLPSDLAASISVTTLADSASDADIVPLSDARFALPVDGSTQMSIDVAVIDDALIETEENFSLVVSAGGGILLLNDQNPRGTLFSEDVASFTVSESEVTVSESGIIATIDVALTAQPVGVVDFDLTLDRTDEVQLNGSRISFTAENWNVPQTITVSARNDQRIDGPQTSLLSIAINTSETDADFANLTTQTVQITSADNDVAGISVLPLNGIVVTESSDSASFTIRLDALPESDVEITLSSTDTTEAVVSPASLVFTSQNGTTPQFVTVTGVDDDLADGNQELFISIAPAVSEDSNFNALKATDMLVVNFDNEALDYGDAADSFPVRASDNGARHVLSDLFLGASVDAEVDGSPSANADSDGSDDDGVIRVASLVTTNASNSMTALRVVASEVGRLDAWIDFNNDGDWNDAGEQVASAISLATGNNYVPVQVPSDSQSGDLHARFRLSSEGSLQPSGPASDGEVEDYLLSIVDANAAATIELQVDSFLEITVHDNALVARNATDDVMRAEVAARSTLNITGTDADDVVQIGNISDLGLGVVIATGDGHDSIRLTSPNQSVFLPGMIDVVRDLEAIDLSGDGASVITLSAEAVVAITDSNNVLSLDLNAEDQVNFQDSWTVAGTELVDGVFYKIVTSGDATIRFTGNGGWTNPLDSLDVSGNGNVSPIDALLILNQISRGTYLEGNAQLVDPATVEDFPNYFFDTNRDGRLTPIDALRIINALARDAVMGEYASLEIAVDRDSDNEDHDQAMAQLSHGLW